MNIQDKLNKSPYLTIVSSNVYCIPERVKEYDPSYFVVWNNRKEQFEIHSTDNVGDTFCMSIPYKELDDRVIKMLYKNDLRNRGSVIFDEIDKENEQLEKSKDREIKNHIKDISKEMHYHVKKAGGDLY